MNHGRIAIVAATSWISRLVTSGIGLISTPVLITALGEDAFAAWAILAGLAPWLGLSQMGLGAALQNAISHRIAREKRYPDLIRRGFLFALAPGAVMAALLLAFNDQWSHALFAKFADLPTSSLVLAFSIGTGGFLAQAIFGLTSNVWFAENRGYLANLVPAASSIIALSGFVAGKGFFPPESLLPFACACYFLPSAIISAAAYFTRLTKAIGTADADPTPYDHLVRQGTRHWIFALLANGVLSIDYLVISQTLFPGEIVTYTVTSKVFGIIFFIFNGVLLAIAPSITRAAARNDWKPAYRLLGFNMIFGIGIVSLSTIVFATFRGEIFALLAPGTAAMPALAFILAFFVYLVLRIWTDSFACVLTSQNILQPLYYSVPFQAIVSLGLQLLLVPPFRETGVIVALTLSFLMTTAWSLPYAVITRARKNQDSPGAEK